MLSFSEEFLEVGTTEFTNGVHEVNNRTLITLNEDTGRAVMWKVACGHENSVSSAHCFSIDGIGTRKERTAKLLRRVRP